MDPPQCVQNAMMKQDKKPFTYTPGGIDLSEIKSPRMARRIERNANYTGEPEISRPPPQHPVGQLPPSALAAMQPQMHVQVFPSGPPPPPPGPRFGPPPPPPPPSANIPPPPPPPTAPLPTQKVMTADNQVLERPDMTKIIPDNPMALLRKTCGPAPKPSFVDEVFGKPNLRAPPAQAAQRWPQTAPPPPAQSSPPPQAQSTQRWPQSPPSPPQQNHHHSPPRYQQPAPVQEPPRYQPKIIEREPPTQKDQILKTSTAHLGSLYIPPLNQEQQLPLEQVNVASPPLPPKRDPQSPQIQSPSLKEAPRPWQKQQKQAEELPPWAKKEPVSPPTQHEQLQQSPPPIAQQQQRFAPLRTQELPQVQQQQRNVQQPQQQQRVAQPPQQRGPQVQNAAQPPPSPNAVYVTQPLVFQHPGPAPTNRPQPKVDAQGAIVIPVQIEGARKVPNTPTTPGNDRSLNRQQSWSNNPTQSNSFKIIQKITQTEDDDEGEDTPVIEHGPKYTQQFQQVPSAEQIRKLKLSEGDRELMNRFKQGIDDDTSVHNEVDPRYRGPAIPSKAFKLLQSMTDGPSDTSSAIGAAVPRAPPGGNRTPQVRNIPIQIERDDQPKNYVHPSEQIVPEPKKYTGSSIPSRSFKILQAMTAPDSCANANEVNENYDPSSYWGYDPNYPLPAVPYWPDYYYYYPQPQPIPNPNPKAFKETNDGDLRQTSAPFWGYYPPPSPYPYMRPMRTPDVESDAETPRSNQMPAWDYCSGYYTPTPTRELEDWNNYPQDNKHEQSYTPVSYQYPPYWDPYYYYYYGYPPIYSPYHFYETSEGEEVAGYSSTDEMAHFINKSKDFRDTSKLETSQIPQALVTPSCSEEPRNMVQESEGDSSESDSETEVETEEEQFMSRTHNSGDLQAIRSVKDIRVYDDEQNCSDEEQNAEDISEETDDSHSYVVEEEETIPHQLSIIYEESERSESRRESSVLSDSTTIAEKSDADQLEEEEDDEDSTVASVKLPLNLNLERVDKEESQVKKEEEEEECKSNTHDTFASFTASPSSSTPQEDKDRNEAMICTAVITDNVSVEDQKGKEEDQDWWGILNKDDDVLPSRRKKFEKVEMQEVVTPQNEDKSDAQKETRSGEDDASSTSSSSSSSCESTSASKKEVFAEGDSSESEEESEEESDSDEEDELHNIKDVNNNAEEEDDAPLSIKERIQALRDSINAKRHQLKEDDTIKTSVKEKVSALETLNLQSVSKATSTKSSVKSLEEFSEEEGDSGVTSDLSRHISDSEEFPELKKMTRYQRAATHSRLYKLLQDECEEEDEKEKQEADESHLKHNTAKEETGSRRDQLSLPLKNVSDESFSSSGITSPGSPVTDKLVAELVHSILKRKKGQIFRNLSKEKLHAAARKILQEEIDDLSTPDSSFLSPVRNSTESSTPAQTPQEFYNDYKQYYDSWSEAEQLCNKNCDILPSKAFRLLQEQSALNRTGALVGLLAKCPKILSSKNVHQELLKLMAEFPELIPKDTSPEPDDVTSAS